MIASYTPFLPSSPFHQTWVLALAAVPKIVGSIKLPGLQSLMTQEVSASEQGILQGSIGSLRTLAKVCASERRESENDLFHYSPCCSINQ